MIWLLVGIGFLSLLANVGIGIIFYQFNLIEKGMRESEARLSRAITFEVSYHTETARVWHLDELEAIETLRAVVTQTDARVLGFTYLKPDVVRVEVEKIVTVPGPTSVRSGTQKVTFPPTHIVFMDADEKNIHDVVQIPVRQRSQIIEFEGSRYECTAGSPELGYFIYRHMTR